MRRVEVEGTVAAPRPAVWKVFTDHVGWTRWAGVKEVVLRQQGDPPPNGLGAIRVIRSGGLAIEEEIVAFDAPKRLAYRLVAGIPVRAHEAEVRLDVCDSGTRITWTARFEPVVPFTGAILAGLMRRTFRDTLDRLARVEFDAGPPASL